MGILLSIRRNCNKFSKPVLDKAKTRCSLGKLSKLETDIVLVVQNKSFPSGTQYVMAMRGSEEPNSARLVATLSTCRFASKRTSAISSFEGRAVPKK